MLNKIKNRKQEGFTIIEVLIVLAIAGLILLIVFLAVPALQRNSRNTSRKNDVAALLGAVTEFTNNNGGTLPNTATVNGTTVNITTGTYSATNQGTAAKVGIYTVTNSVSLAAVSTGVTNANDTEKVQLVTGAKCGATTGPGGASNSAVAGTGRGVVALYAVESGGGSTTTICQEG